MQNRELMTRPRLSGAHESLKSASPSSESSSTSGGTSSSMSLRRVFGLERFLIIALVKILAGLLIKRKKDYYK